VERYMSAYPGVDHAVHGQRAERSIPRACVFISNHRDIALDPAFVNYALFTAVATPCASRSAATAHKDYAST
jgi:hypothetical protein